jgi:pimeloyl-ACP methyl ester carboxylesterase
MTHPEPVTISDEAAIRHLELAVAISGVEVSDIVLPRPRSLQIGELRFHFLDWEAPEGAPPVVFLHGGGLNAHTWDLVCLALHHEYHCYALDQRGHGDTDWSPVGEYGREHHVQDIAAFIRQLGIDRPVVVGMSLGGLNTMAYAGGRNDLAGVVLVDVGPEFEIGPVGDLMDFMSAGTEPGPRQAFIDRALRFNRRRNRNLLETSVLRNIREDADGHWTWKYDPRAAITGTPDEVRAANLWLWDAVARITCPVLVVRGAESPIFTQPHAERLVGKLKDARLEVVQDAGHTVQGDNPAGLIRVLRPFFERVLPIRPE